MPKYVESDDGKVVNGKTVVFLRPGPAGDPQSSSAERAETAQLQAAALVAAARGGVPFCAECAQARRDLKSKDGSPT